MLNNKRFDKIVNWPVFKGLGFICFGCLTNVVILEEMLRVAKGSTIFVTFMQFLFVSITDSYILLENRHVKFYNIGVMTLLFFSSNFATNIALDFGVEMPVHIIVKSSTLVCVILVGAIFLRREYSREKVMGALLVTLGLICVTFAETKSEYSFKDCCNFNFFFQDNKELLNSGHSSKLRGYAFLVAGLLLTAFSSLFQEYVLNTDGKFPEEVKFYSQACSLPIFIGHDYRVIENFFHVYSNSQPLSSYVSTLESVPIIGRLPILWTLLIASVITSYFCISGVFILHSATDSVTLNFVLTIRKFLSLIFSVWYFKNPFSTLHWIGSLFVFGGAMVYLIKPMQVKSKTN